MYSIVWFKKDLRLSDHAPLTWAVADARLSGGAVLALWVYEPSMWQQADASARHLGFANECLAELEAEIAQDNRTDFTQPGGALLRCHGEMIEVLTKLKALLGGFNLVSHEETGNGWSYARDKAVAAWCRASGVAWRQFPSNAVVRALNAHGGRDRWGAQWAARMRAAPLPTPQDVPWLLARPSVPPPMRAPRVAALGAMQCGALTALDLRMPDRDARERQRGARARAWRELFSFLSHRGQHYRADMSSPLAGATSCSRLSPHLAWGTISIKETLHATWARRGELMALPADARPAGLLASLKSFAGRLHWHCHFIQKLESESAIEFRNVNRAFDHVRNEGVLSVAEEAKFTAWAEGKTGFPFVDACMRSLTATGWINFRMRAMLVSFASYHLWLHWRVTGCHLARLFTDYEPGIHWSQLQMQSGVTGINTVRIYNPVKQSYDQDPLGVFIRRWVPELASLESAFLHEPWNAPQLPLGYPAPIVDLEAAGRIAKDRIYGKKAEPATKAEARAVFQKHGSRKRTRERAGKAKPKPDTHLGKPGEQFQLNLEM